MDENIVSEVIDDVEKIFTPKPGGIVDRHRKEKARREEAQRERENEDEPVEQAAYKSVKVTPLSPEIFVPQTFTIQPGGNTPILPNGPYRYRATVLVITTNATVILCKDSGAAISAMGFTLPYGIPVAVYSRAQLYAYNNTGAPAQVSVIAEVYAPEMLT